MTNSKTYTQDINLTISECVERELDRVVEKDKNGDGINVFVFHIRSEDDERWEELLSYDNKNNSADFSQRAKDVISAETLHRISNFGKEVSHPIGIPYSIRKEFVFAFEKANDKITELSIDGADEEYICREEGFIIPQFNGVLHFSKQEFDDEYVHEIPKYEPYFILPNMVYIFYPEQVFAFDNGRQIIDWPE